MADKKVKVQVDVETNVEQSIAGLKQLKKQLKETAAGSAEFKRLANEIDDLEDKIKGSRQGAADWIDTLESAGGPIGAVGAALNKAKVATVSWGTALKATGIGLVVAAIGGLVAAFSESEKATKKLQPLLIGFQKIFNGIFAAIEPVFDSLIGLATEAMPYVTKAFGVAYSAISSFLQGIGKLGQAVGKLIKGDFTGAWDTAKDAVTGFGKRYEDANKRFIEGTKEVTSTEKENLEERRKAQQEAAQKAKEAAEKAFQEKLKRMEAENKLDEAALEKLKQEALVLATTEQQKLDVEKQFAEKSYQLRLKDLSDKQALYAKDSTDYKELEAEKIKLQSEFIAKTGEFGTKQKEINEKNNKELMDAEISALQLRRAKGEIEESAYQQSLFDIKKKYVTDSKELTDAEIALETYKTEQKKKSAEEERGILLSNLQSKFEALDAENERIDGDFQQDLERFAMQKQILNEQEAAELANTELTEFQKTEIRKKYADARMGIVNQEIATEKAAAAAKHEINMAYLGLFEQFGNLLGQIAGKNKALAIAGIVISQAASIGQIIANTAIANAKSVAASPLTLGQPWVAINTISAGLSIASTIAAAAKSIQQINSQPGPTASNGSAGGGSAASLPKPPTTAGASAPQIQSGQGVNATTQIAQTMAASQKPIKAYVVSGDVSSQQALDRRTSRAATFTGG